METNKNSLNYWLSLLFSFFILGLLLWGCWYFFGIFNSLQPAVQAALITATLGFMAVIITNLFTSQRELNLKLREKRVEVYSKLVEGWITTLYKVASESKKENKSDNNGDITKNQSLQEFTNLLLDITDDLILWSSDEILKKYSEFREQLPDEQSSDFEQQLGVIRFAKFMLAIREDVGHKNKGIDEYDLMSLVLQAKEAKKFRELKPTLDSLLDSQNKLSDKSILS